VIGGNSATASGVKFLSGMVPEVSLRFTALNLRLIFSDASGVTEMRVAFKAGKSAA